MLTRRRTRAKTTVSSQLPKQENKVDADVETTSSAESDAAESHTTVDDKDILFNEVFGNDLIWDKISEHLAPGDLKIASATSRLLFHKIRNQRSFMDRLKLLICGETYNRRILNRTRLEWKNCDIELSKLPTKALRSIQRLMFSMESVELYEAYGTSEKDRNHFIKEIVPSAPNLRSLTLDCSIIERLSNSLLLEQDLQNSLGKLEELRIVTGRLEENKMVSCSDGFKSTFPQNILTLSEIPMKLKSFEFQKVDTYYGSQKEHVTYLPQLIRNNRHTMQHLRLQLHMWSLEPMKSLACPILKSLYITAYRRNDSIVNAFIEKQPLLEKLCVQFKNGFPLSVLYTISQRGSKLQQLHLKASSFTESPELVDWSFLLNFKSLVDFKMFQPRAYIGPHETQGTVSQILNALPDKMKKICLRGLEHGWAGDLTTNTITCIQRFRNLTELSLMRCEEVINDDILQFICSHHQRLLILEFSHTQSLSDFGLTGIRTNDNGEEENSGVSLKNLKGLRKLTMRECRRISDTALLSTIEFQELTKLDLAIRSEPLSNSTITQLVRQNPSLESFSVHWPIEPSEVSAIALKKLNPRFKHINAVQDDWNVEDSDSDAEEFDEFEESSENGSFDSWDWESDFDDEDDIIIAWGPNAEYSDMSDPDDFD